ncbi:serpin B8 [Caerostris darwini]|uniref:Serpin B8 n=1 Tax=Caerostris darwini TaxID=1538125 RepID=A0AAV4X0T4_9ARAC|nr:serpin B8 [Caerostris darwini]
MFRHVNIRINMKINFALFCALLALGVAFSRAGDEPLDPQNYQKLTEANNEFAFSLHRMLAGNKSANVFFSPFSISAALDMLLLGAKGSTAEELEVALGYKKADLKGDVIHETSGKFLGDILKSNQSDAGYVLNSANAVVVDARKELTAEFEDKVKQLYQANVQKADFAKDSSKTVKEINDWVVEKTEGKITDLVQDLDPATVAILMNAVYFKGTWKHQFNEQNTRDEIFYNHGDLSQEKQVPFMIMSANVGTARLEHVNVLELPKLKKDRIEVMLPKFKLEYGKELTKELQALGAKGIFASGADFSGMTSDKDMFVSEILHKATIEVNEKGSEAAAGTRVATTRTMPARFKADHPFLFAVVRKSGDGYFVLFLGCVKSF